MTYYNRQSIEKYIEPFKNWLVGRGAEVLETKNGTELIRFKAEGKYKIITASPKGELHFHDDTLFIFENYRKRGPWRACHATLKLKSHQRGGRLHAVRVRDGDLCFFCQELVSVEDQSEEHLVAKTFGGPNHLANILLAHKRCNAETGHLSASEKIAVHVKAKFGKLQEKIAALEHILKTPTAESAEGEE